MKRHTFLALAVLTSAALALPAAAQAQSQSSATGASATARHTAKKHAAKKKSKPSARKAKKGTPVKEAKASAPAQAQGERLTNAEQQTAQQVYIGTFPCDLGEKVSVAADAAHPGLFVVTSGKRRYVMHPVESRTGAIRMEDDRRSAVWLQLGTKSMLMDQKAGQRVADDCVAPAQKDYAAHMQDHPAQKLFDAPAASQQNVNQAGNAPAVPVGNAPGSAGQASAQSTEAAQAPASDAQPVFAPVGGNRNTP